MARRVALHAKVQRWAMGELTELADAHGLDIGEAVEMLLAERQPNLAQKRKAKHLTAEVRELRFLYQEAAGKLRDAHILLDAFKNNATLAAGRNLHTARRVLAERLGIERFAKEPVADVVQALRDAHDSVSVALIKTRHAELDT